MSVIFTVNFMPSSLSEFEDELTIINEENIFKIPIKAMKESPNINLPELMGNYF